MPKNHGSERDIIESLINIGIKERESRLYYALLRVPEATAAELQHMSGVPRTKIYESLEALSRRGFCKTRQSGRTRYFQATPPDEVAHQLSTDWRQELDSKLEQADGVFGDLLDFYRRRSDVNLGLDAVEVIRTNSVIARRYLGLVESTEEEILSFVRMPLSGGFKPGTKYEQDSAEEGACKRGVRRRSIYRYEADHLDWMRHNIAMSREIDAGFRITAELPLKMFIFDRRVSLFALPSVPGVSGTDFTMVVVRDTGLAAACKILFETVWREAKTLEEWERDGPPIFVEA